jgi:hypothetical protein
VPPETRDKRLIQRMKLRQIRAFARWIGAMPGIIGCVFFTQHLPENGTEGL